MFLATCDAWGLRGSYDIGGYLLRVCFVGVSRSLSLSWSCFYRCDLLSLCSLFRYLFVWGVLSWLCLFPLPFGFDAWLLTLHLGFVGRWSFILFLCLFRFPVGFSLFGIL